MGNLRHWRLALWLVAILPGSGLVMAAAAADLVESLRGCSAHAEREVRLACFDRIAGGLPQSVAPVVVAAAAPVDSQAGFGFSPEQLQRASASQTPAKSRLGELSARVARAQRMGNGGWRIVLDNGQIWSQVSPAEAVNPAPGSEVVIKPASFGSYLLIDADRHSARMHRLQ